MFQGASVTMEMIDSGSLAVILPINSTGMCFVSGQENPGSDFHLYVLQWMLNSASFGFNLFLFCFFLNILLEALQVYSGHQDGVTSVSLDWISTASTMKLGSVPSGFQGCPVLIKF